MPTVDLRIDDAFVVDGTGEPGSMGSVAVDGGRIVAMDEDLSAHRVIDAGGAVLAPGFIDLHTHCDFTLPVYPSASAMVRQGVTTQVVGNCGFSPFPAPAERRGELAEYTAFIDAGIDWERWEDAAGFMAYLGSCPLACNVAVQVGLGTVRFAAMGFVQRRASDGEMGRMKEHVADAMRAGAVGVSSGLVYAPGRFASTDEVTRLVSVASSHGGFYSSHIRNEAGALVEAVNEAISIAETAGVPLQLSHHKALGPTNWGAVETTLALIDTARAQGMDVLADQYPYRAGSTALTQILPGWALEDGVAGMRRTLLDPERRAAVVAALTGSDPDAIRDFDPESILLAEIPDGKNKRFEGWFLVDVAAELAEDPVDTALRLLVEEGSGILMVVFGMSEDDVRRVMAHPAVAVASDGWTLRPEAGGNPHPRSYGTYARVLGHYVRSEAVLSLETAIHKMTGLPAQRLPGLDRGLIAPGRVADLVLFDPDRIRDLASFEEPHRFCEGVHHVLVSGVPVVEDGAETGASPGSVLRRQGVSDPVE